MYALTFSPFTNLKSTKQQTYLLLEYTQIKIFLITADYDFTKFHVSSCLREHSGHFTYLFGFLAVQTHLN